MGVVDVTDRLHLRQPVLYMSNDALLLNLEQDWCQPPHRFMGNLNMFGPEHPLSSTSLCAGIPCMMRMYDEGTALCGCTCVSE